MAAVTTVIFSDARCPICQEYRLLKICADCGRREEETTCTHTPGARPIASGDENWYCTNCHPPSE